MGDARDKGDVHAAKRRAQLGFFFLLPLLGITAEPVHSLPPGKIELSSKESAALTRLIQRLKQQFQQSPNGSTDSAALLKLLTCPDAQQLEDMYTSSLQQRAAGKELKGSTIQDQVRCCQQGGEARTSGAQSSLMSGNGIAYMLNKHTRRHLRFR